MSNVCFGLSLSLTAYFGAFFPSEGWWEVRRLCKLWTLKEVMPTMKVLEGASLRVLRPAMCDSHDEGAWGNKLSFLLFCLLPSFLTQYQMYSASGIIMFPMHCSVSSVCYNNTVPEMTFLGSWPEIQGADKKCFSNEAALVRATHEDYL